MLKEQNHYEFLGIERDATVPEIRKAFRKIAAPHNPDQNDSEESKEIFNRATQALNLLKDPELRAEYDKVLDMANDARSNTLVDEKEEVILEDVEIEDKSNGPKLKEELDLSEEGNAPNAQRLKYTDEELEEIFRNNYDSTLDKLQELLNNRILDQDEIDHDFEILRYKNLNRHKFLLEQYEELVDEKGEVQSELNKFKATKKLKYKDQEASTIELNEYITRFSTFKHKWDKCIKSIKSDSEAATRFHFKKKFKIGPILWIMFIVIIFILVLGVYIIFI